MTIVNIPWDGSASRYDTTDNYCKASLIDENPSGQDKVQALCKLPICEPNGDINSNAVHAAVAALAGGRGGVKAKPESKKAAAKKLLSIYRDMKENPPPSLTNIAQ